MSQRWPILNNDPFMCPLLWSFVSSPLHPPSHLGVPAVRQLQVSLSGKFYLLLNSAPPLFVAGSTGSTLLSTKQTVNSSFMPLGCDTSTTYSSNMFYMELLIEKRKDLLLCCSLYLGEDHVAGCQNIYFEG